MSKEHIERLKELELRVITRADAAAIEWALGVVSRLPVTLDGVVVTPHMELWANVPGHDVPQWVGRARFASIRMTANNFYADVNEIYSTQAAAEQAAGEGKG